VKIEDVYELFGSRSAVAKKLNVSYPTLINWEKSGKIPYSRQQAIELISEGKLSAKKEDTFTISPQENYLPLFRFYDDQMGMSIVESISFVRYKRAKIIIFSDKNLKEKCLKFSKKNLMQAVNLKDTNDNILFEGDICLFKNGEKIEFLSINMFEIVKEKGEFKIIGNIYEDNE